MRFIIPIVIILTLASCTNKAKLIETCADEDFLKDYGIVEQCPLFSSASCLTDEQYLYEVDFVESIREGSISLQKKLSGTNYTGSYEGYYKQCEVSFSKHPETFKQKYK